MKILFIVDEFPFFLPEYLDKTVQSLKKEHEIVGITPLITPHGQKTLYSYLMENIYRLDPVSIFKLFIESVKLKLGQFQYSVHMGGGPHSIGQVARKHHIKKIETKSVNSEAYIQKIKKLKPDIIVSSCSQIFKKEILKTPKISCINRHSALLPAYGGLFPIFQAMIHNEKKVGVTVHEMVIGIDKGEILSQESFVIKKEDTLFSLYRRSYEVSVAATANAVKKLSTGKYKKIILKTKPSYFSFPGKKDWEYFWLRKEKII